ncbi:hypothetical protein [Desulfovibrio inopinatus]|uniref:hypothetical protein n=1 Tax=Desulfovibrio inopinatus TaxID=102109 RepID=UPI000401B45A|nr:hypothetical protein [Desulfovibrio inopinatus]
MSFGVAMNYFQHLFQDQNSMTEVQGFSSAGEVVAHAQQHGYQVSEQHLKQAAEHVIGSLKGVTPGDLKQRPDLIKKIDVQERQIGISTPEGHPLSNTEKAQMEIASPDIVSTGEEYTNIDELDPTLGNIYGVPVQDTQPMTPQQKSVYTQNYNSAINLAQDTGLSKKKAVEAVKAQIFDLEMKGMSPAKAALYVRAKEQAIENKMSIEAHGDMSSKEVTALREKCAKEVDSAYEKAKSLAGGSVSPLEAMQSVSNITGTEVLAYRHMMSALEAGGLSPKEAQTKVREMLANLNRKDITGANAYEVLGVLGHAALKNKLSLSSIIALFNTAVSVETRFPSVEMANDPGKMDVQYMTVVCSKITPGENVTPEAAKKILDSFHDQVAAMAEKDNLNYDQAAQILSTEHIFSSTLPTGGDSAQTYQALNSYLEKKYPNMPLAERDKLIMEAGVYIAAKMQQGGAAQNALEDFESQMNAMPASYSPEEAVTIISSRVDFENIQSAMGVSKDQADAMFDERFKEGIAEGESPAMAAKLATQNVGHEYNYLKNFLANIKKVYGEKGVKAFLKKYEDEVQGGMNPKKAVGEALKELFSKAKGSNWTGTALKTSMEWLHDQEKLAFGKDGYFTTEPAPTNDNPEAEKQVYHSYGRFNTPEDGAVDADSEGAGAQDSVNAAEDSSDVNFSKAAEGSEVDTAADVGADASEAAVDDVVEAAVEAGVEAGVDTVVDAVEVGMDVAAAAAG